MTEPGRVGDALRRRLRDTTRRLMGNLHLGLQAATPVDTGFAVTNWVPSVGGPFEGTAGTRAEAEDGHLDHGPAAAGLAAIRAYELEQGDVFDTNNVDYIEKLNAGSSGQAPAAFVQAEIVGAIESVRGRSIEGSDA